ncbi:glutaredoxin-C9-like [Diospyros lotus]|uniref:glutaredoxin-C9-like n=1 Tax=Diospyros lotus TaxID=55363 RepID=UPI00225A1CB5|nr:glutaredoxin-C9-like [Diospyros lotus]
MQKAIPYRAWPAPPSSSAAPGGSPSASVQQLAAENAVIVFGQRGCCMCHVVKRLLLGLGANPPVVELDEGEAAAAADQLSRISGGGEGGEALQFPAVFVGGKLFGGLERVMATHISGELVPILKEAGALWL